MKTKSSVRYHFLSIRIILVARSLSCLHEEYKPVSSPEPLALKALLFMWSVQWLLLQCAAALQRCMEQTLWSRLRCWAQWHWYFTHFKLFYFPNIIGLVRRIIRFVMRTKPKTSYRMVQYVYRYTPNICICVYIYISGGPLSALTCCVNVRLLSAIKKISPLIYSQSWVGSWVYTTQAMMTFTLIF